MDNFRIDGRRWRFLNRPHLYIERADGGLLLEPLTRQIKTAKEILDRFTHGQGVLLADDVGLGKTTVGAIVAWIIACHDKRVRIYAPNEIMRRRWAEELERHIPMLKPFGASSDRIRQGNVEKLKPGQIQVTTHYSLVRSYHRNELRTACDLMIIDEAHRAKGDGSAFNSALRGLGDHAKRKLVLTATPFSIRLTELEQLLHLVGAKKIDGVLHYADELRRIYNIKDGLSSFFESKRIVTAAKNAIEDLQPYLIRHGIDDLPVAERKHFGRVSERRWEIPTAPASQEELSLLLRLDRILQLVPERRGERRNDPRFHTGWNYLSTELDRAAVRAKDAIVRKHIDAAYMHLRTIKSRPHPKMAAVCNAIRSVLLDGEKVLVFCHHHATASELLNVLEKELVKKYVKCGTQNKVWRDAWDSLLPKEDPLIEPIIDWLCSPGICAQISGWIGVPAATAKALADQLTKMRPRNAKIGVPTIYESAIALVKSLLDRQSTSTRSLLRSIAKGDHFFGGAASFFPGRLEDGYCVMGAWQHDLDSDRPKTLYTGKADIVIALFNSPFGPDVLVATDQLSEGVDLHRYCRHLIHYELDPSPVRTLQRNGRIRRVGSWAALSGKPIEYAYPSFVGTRDEKVVKVMGQRISAFGLLLGGVPQLDDNPDVKEQYFVDEVLEHARNQLVSLNRKLSVQV